MLLRPETYEWLPKHVPAVPVPCRFSTADFDMRTPMSLRLTVRVAAEHFPIVRDTLPGPPVSTSKLVPCPVSSKYVKSVCRFACTCVWSVKPLDVKEIVHFAAEPSRFWGLCNDKRVSSENPMQGDISASSLANLWKSVSKFILYSFRSWSFRTSSVRCEGNGPPKPSNPCRKNSTLQAPGPRPEPRPETPIYPYVFFACIVAFTRTGVLPRKSSTETKEQPT